MNIYFLIAGILCFILGLVHSILGEILIFSSKRDKGRIVPSKKGPGLRESHLRIIWATWHLASVFGWAFGVVVIKISSINNTLSVESTDIIIQSIIYAMIAGSLLVLIGTKGRHPGWIVLLTIGILLIIGNLN